MNLDLHLAAGAAGIAAFRAAERRLPLGHALLSIVAQPAVLRAFSPELADVVQREIDAAAARRRLDAMLNAVAAQAPWMCKRRDT